MSLIVARVVIEVSVEDAATVTDAECEQVGAVMDEIGFRGIVEQRLKKSGVDVVKFNIARD